MMAVATVKEQCYTYDNFCVRKTKYIIHNVQDYSVLHITFLARLYMWGVTILLTYGMHLHDRIISPKGEVRVHRMKLTPPLFIEVSLPGQESERSCICVFGYRFLLHFLRFWNCSDSVAFFLYFFCFF